MSERALGEPEVMGAAEAARTLGVAQSNLRKVVGLPDPYQRLRSGTLWRADEIRALAWRRLARATTTTTTTHQPVA